MFDVAFKGHQVNHCQTRGKNMENNFARFESSLCFAAFLFF
ncbi:hypothetical protein T260_03110 [Geobacillus thermopakistaniensis]|uniref:Transposase n=1 Tax=Geobacillus thermopakistaniensis (strain MAS1) TaxID=1408282 RepID=A0A7U9JDR9_GEOTM|nr:hypothetical protein [Geobacillus kaustophilus]ESU73436.1 hypothetical protein T260_03110 [Geobacillus sp. MAS1]WJQ09255.1 hypothetical protein QT237_10765 [Geobacillus stearothermophilus]